MDIYNDDIDLQNVICNQCERCDILYELKLRDRIFKKLFEEYEEDIIDASETELKYEVGVESVKKIYKNKCRYSNICEKYNEYIERIDDYEINISKLLYKLVDENREKDTYYISSKISTYYPVLTNRIIRSDRSKKSVLLDRYNAKEFIEKFKTRDDI